MMSTSTRWSAAGAAICLTATCLLSACSPSTAGSSAPPSAGSGAASVCDEVQQVTAGVHNLQTMNLSENGMVAMTEAVGSLRTELQQLRAAAKDAYEKQLATLQSAVADVRAKAQAAKADPSSASLAAVKESLTALATAVKGAADAASC
jgi:hypothetical protein